jgi:hypothetical protein
MSVSRLVRSYEFSAVYQLPLGLSDDRAGDWVRSGQAITADSEQRRSRVQRPVSKQVILTAWFFSSSRTAIAEIVLTGCLVPACRPVRTLVYDVVKGSSCLSIMLRQEHLAFIKAISTLQLSPALLRELRMAISIPPMLFCRNKIKTLLYPFVHRGSQRHCAVEQQWRCTVLTVGKSHTQNAVDGYMTPVTQSQHLNLRTIGQLRCTPIH